MNETPKNREWVKNAAIVFLAVLLVLTFFSNTIMNRSLPEVATQDVTDGAIVSKVRGSGTVTANGNNQVKMEKTRVIRAVMVKAGQEVKAGDVLFTLGEGSSEEIEALEEKIRNLQNSYNRTAVSGHIALDCSGERVFAAPLVEEAVGKRAGSAVAQCTEVTVHHGFWLAPECLCTGIGVEVFAHPDMPAPHYRILSADFAPCCYYSIVK